MSEAMTYQRLLETSQRANWRLEDVIGAADRLDFSKRARIEQVAPAFC